MKKNTTTQLLVLLFLLPLAAVSQSPDTTRPLTTFSGSLGLTTNGFSIVPSFSLNSPAYIVQLGWRRRQFSIDPDIRMTPDLRKGGIILWFRYYPVEGKRFSLRVGAHPALNFQRRDVVENGVTTHIGQMRHFLAWELAPNLRLGSKGSIGIYVLDGYGLQGDHPRTTHFITLNGSVRDLRIGGDLRLALSPAVYYLNVDGKEGTYLTATAAISHPGWPLSLESTINQTFHSVVPNNKIFMWNLSLKYNFSKKLAILKK